MCLKTLRSVLHEYSRPNLEVFQLAQWLVGSLELPGNVQTLRWCNIRRNSLAVFHFKDTSPVPSVIDNIYSTSVPWDYLLCLFKVEFTYHFT